MKDMKKYLVWTGSDWVIWSMTPAMADQLRKERTHVPVDRQRDRAQRMQEG